MKDLMELWCKLALELGQLCCTSTDLDRKTAEERFEAEGLAFLTLTLPDLGKALERGLEIGYLESTSFPAFKGKRGLPLFLRGFTRQIFDEASGHLLETPNKDCIWAVRQLTLAFAKILIECSQERQEAALDGYLKTEQEVRRMAEDIAEEDYERLHRMAVFLFDDLFEAIDDRLLIGDIICGHGPGNTADGLSGNRKFDQVEWPERLNVMFPFGDHAQPSPSFHYLGSRVDFLDLERERPVKVVLVPKTQKTMRVIAEEPTCMMYVQKGISEELVKDIENHPILGSFIGFTQQWPNQLLACEGSLNGDLATLDLSEASDRVSYEHVRVMLQDYPFLWNGVDAARSRKAHVRGEIIQLAKFASMGSALCFPMEAMVFLTVIFLGIEAELGRPLTRNDLKSFRGQVRVYGDDIIVPVRFVPSVIHHLEAFGFKVNKDKSFWNGKFRESCGKEYYDGFDVSISRVRRVFPKSRTDALEIVSLVSLRNQLYLAGCFDTAEYLDSVIEPLLRKGGRSYYPRISINLESVSHRGIDLHFNPFQREEEFQVKPGGRLAAVSSGEGSGSRILGRFNYGGYDADHRDPDTHQPMVKGWVVKTTLPAIAASGEGALLKYFLKRSDLPFADREHLERSGRPKPASFKLRLDNATPF